MPPSSAAPNNNPDLRTIRGVELVKVGSWEISTGTWTVTAADLQSAVAAHAAGVLRKPVIKLGHQGPMRDAAPALGHVDGLRLTDDGQTLVGDLVNVPARLAAVLASAYPDRSVEALIDYQDTDGTVWPLVLSALSLLGATAPGIDTLHSLQDVTDLYGVAASRRITLASSLFTVDREKYPDAAGRARAVAVAAARRRRNHRTSNTIGA
ncbi:hypothetical protein DDJ48_21525 [Mycobacteroides abscessus]|uniref:hypothetical protein n=1 Tax=Mycobacteroides abscessus TaxID=36809 RepID=UPI000A32E493|nr:hypothetical protein [Mycobacteroides abscessus]MDM3924165.1 hypothetical protein [Mycobacteroides abscessus]MDO2967600.1 hypothetical protein [Mycobacteroides abscessus subsp. abscessus]MDO2978450.1 hypothetical protein [Mycobacteroides abscessus subsp. abscessus]MDO3110232.1 hypothetical protein [Mycobacteroides abscessus subsp. abscessus]MDO3259541.1 hypothetical protein [Mycobacteroides abscessus subsp. abscessus]